VGWVVCSSRLVLPLLLLLLRIFSSSINPDRQPLWVGWQIKGSALKVDVATPPPPPRPFVPKPTGRQHVKVRVNSTTHAPQSLPA
jgi:hypothetical protein